MSGATTTFSSFPYIDFPIYSWRALHDDTTIGKTPGPLRRLRSFAPFFRILIPNMTTLNDYLVQKRAAWLAKREAARNDPDLKPVQLKATVRALGRSGVREIRIRDFQVISDSPADFAGYDLGPASPELQLGVLGSCLTHITLIQAAERQLRIDSIDVAVTGEQHPLAQQPGFENIPIFPHNIRYTLHIVSPESAEAIRALHDAVEAVCPIFNLLKQPQTIVGELRHTEPSRAAV